MHQVAIFSKRSIVDVWQYFEYASGSEYTRFLNMLPVLNMPGFWIYFSRNIRRFSYARVSNIPLLKCKEFWGFHFLKYKRNCAFFFVFWPGKVTSWGFQFCEIDTSSVSLNIKNIFEISVSWNIRNFLRGFHFLKCKKVPFHEM